MWWNTHITYLTDFFKLEESTIRMNVIVATIMTKPKDPMYCEPGDSVGFKNIAFAVAFGVSKQNKT